MNPVTPDRPVEIGAGVRPEQPLGWRPILGGEEAQAAVALAEEIAVAIAPPKAVRDAVGPLESKSPGSLSVSLAYGWPGTALFLAYLAKATGESRYGDWAADHLEAAVELVARLRLAPGLFFGFSGVAWAMSQVSRTLFGEVDSTMLAEIDEGLLTALDVDRWTDHFELMHGLVGFGVYALERLPDPAGKQCLERLVHHLARVGDARQIGRAWRTRPEHLPPDRREARPSGDDNLGLAHGQLAVVSILAGAAARQTDATAGLLLTEAVSWLLAQRLDTGRRGFPAETTGPGSERPSGRLAWCYGDAVNAHVVLVAAQVLGRSDWEAEARRLALACASSPSRPFEIDNAGICHGCAGVAHVFARLWQITGEEVLARTGRAWIQSLLRLRREGSGIAGFSFQEWDTRRSMNQLRALPGVLNGAAGVGLALLAAATSSPPDWDAMLLLAPPAHVPRAAPPESKRHER